VRHVGCSIAKLSVTVTMPSVSVNEGFDRLQRLLLAMHVGDEVGPMEVADETGLSAETCRAVLLGLERAGLMARREDDRFRRQQLQFGA
jgi:DNA-binding IclR family transcriptional regulator